MATPSKKTMAERDRLVAIFNGIRTEQMAENTVRNRERVVWASAVLSWWITNNCPPPRNGWACKAGKRQTAERRAMHRR